MKLSIATTAIAMAVTALAAPAELDVRTGAGDSHEEICGNKGKQVCCNGLLDCIITLNICENNAYCCKTDSPDNTLININLLTCLKLF